MSPACDSGRSKPIAPRRIASGIGDPTGSRDAPSLSRHHFRKAVCPARQCAVGRTCVDDSDGRINDGVYCLACGGIGQTENGDVAGVDGFCATAPVFALCGGKREQRDVGPIAQPFESLSGSVCNQATVSPDLSDLSRTRDFGNLGATTLIAALGAAPIRISGTSRSSRTLKRSRPARSNQSFGSLTSRPMRQCEEVT